MSLINEALKRAQESQKKHSPSPLTSAPLHTVPTKQGSAIPWSIGVVVLLIIGAMAFMLLTNSKNNKRQVADTAQAKAVPVAEPIAPTPVPEPAPVMDTAPVIDPAPETAPPPPQPVTTASGIPAPALQPVVEPSAAPQLKLQAIFYRPQNPSVIINGKTLSTGERILGAQVQSITPGSVTLLVDGQAKEMRLE